ncbi:MAG: hypothetical protein F9K27_10065 [Anaerolineae bacterium]|nr:MAG: hypothetical protein F9K27_10065 [Anaerolineae bacterium]
MKQIKILFLFILLLLIPASYQMVSARSPVFQQDGLPPVIVTFTSELKTVTVAEAEAGTVTTNLSWQTFGVRETDELQLYAYEISTWVRLVDENGEPLALEPNSSVAVPVRHPLNFNPPTYRLIIVDEFDQSVSEKIVTIPYAGEEIEAAAQPTPTGTTTTTPPPVTVVAQPELLAFTAVESSIAANDLVYGDPRINVSWQVANRTSTSNLVFEQVLPNGTSVNVELPRGNLWVSSSGSGAIRPVYPEGDDTVVLRLRLVDLATNETLSEAAAVVAISGTVSTPTPRPTQAPQPTQDPNQAQQPAPANSGNPAPVVAAGAGGGYEIGGHVNGYGFVNEMRSAGMSWVKKQIRWRRGEGTGAAAGAISEAHANGFKILLGIVGFREDMGDFENYTNEFAAYLGQVAALGPEAIEVWNEPNIDREWPAGTISGGSYTQMLAKAYNAIKANNSGVMVISGAPAPTGFFGGSCTASGCDDNVFLAQMANAGAAQYMDCVGAHYNEGIISPDNRSGDPRGGHYTRYFWGMLDLYYNAFGGSRKVCWTELGYLSPEGYGQLPPAFGWAGGTTLAQHAEWLGRASRLSRDSGRVRLMIIWNVDFRNFGDDPMGGYAIIRPDGSCPACGPLAASVQ